MGRLLALLLLAPPLLAAPEDEVYELVPPNAVAGDRVGAAVALTAGRALVGAPEGDGAQPDSGTVHVFDVDGGLELLVLAASDGATGDRFGASVNVDAGLVAVGAPEHAGSGAVYLFDLATGQELAKLAHPFGSPGDRFGQAVAVEAGLLAVGVPGAQSGRGAVRVFDAVTGKGLYHHSGSTGDALGTDVAAGAGLLVVGIPLADLGLVSDAGTVRVFDLADGKKRYTISAPADTPGAGFGARVAVRGDRIAVGNWLSRAFLFDALTKQNLFVFDYPAATVLDVDLGLEHVAVALVEAGLGRVEVLVQASGQPSHTLVSSDLASQDGFGGALSLGDDAVLVGAPQGGEGGVASGSAYLFGVLPEIGASYCGPAALNSTGRSAEVHAYGSLQAAANKLLLEAISMPPAQAGYFLASETQSFVPFVGGSQGHLCLGGAIARFNHPVLVSDAAGRFELAADLTDIPLDPPHTVVAGETWNFQAWFRDVNPVPTSNLTNGVSVLYQ